MKAVVFEQFGDPAQVLQVRDVPTPEPGRGEVRVRMLASPINPSDLMVVRGQYGFRPPLPATPGFEGAGVIDAVGSGLLARVRGLKPGRRVAVLSSSGGNWREYTIVSARNAVPVPAGLNDEQVATFFVNPATVLAMVRHVLKVPAGGWLLQTAAGSALGRMVIRLGRRDGFRTINVIRRRDAAESLRRLGADEVIVSTETDIEGRVRSLTANQGVHYALDPVGGEMGSAAARCLGQGGRLLLYGTLSGEPLSIDPRALMTGNASIEGFWLSIWTKKQRALTMLKLFRAIASLLQDGTFTTEIAATFPVDQIQAAARQAGGQSGKVLLRIGSS
jgi:NADPH:quinone reductase